MAKIDNLYIYDATLREGAQKTGISYSAEDKIRILERLIDDLHIPMVEVGWPGSNPKDVEFFERANELNLKNAKITAFGSTCKVDKKPVNDANIQAMLEAAKEYGVYK